MEIKIYETTVIIASEGHVFRRKEDGKVFGDIVYLGYVYYINDIPLPQAKLETPEDYEEIPADELISTQEEGIIKRLENLVNVIKDTSGIINSLNLTETQAIEFKTLFPKWEDFTKESNIPDGYYFTFNGKLFKSLIKVTNLGLYIPGSIGSESIFKSLE